MNWGSHRLLWVLLLLALIIRLGWAISRPVDDAAIDALPDQREYLSLARNLLHGQGLQFVDARFNETVKAFRMPGYPLFVAACGANVRAVRIVQAGVDASTVLAIFLLARRLLGGRAAPLIAAGFVALNPFLIFFTGLLLTETLFTAMLAWAMWLFVVGSDAEGPKRARLAWLGALVLLALAVLVRPSAIVLAPTLAALSMLLNPAPRDSYDKLGQNARYSGGFKTPAFVAVIVLLLSLLPWVIRNRIAVGSWVWLDTNGGFTLYDGYNPDATGRSDQSFVSRMPELQQLDEVGRDTHLREEALDFARTHPWHALRLARAKLARTWSPVPLSDEYAGRPTYVIVALAYSVPFDLLVLLGLARGRLPRGAKIFLLAPALGFGIIHALTVGSLRYRIPAEPLLAVVIAGLAAGGAAQTWRRARSA